MSEPELTSQLVNILLSEFNSLKSEIQARSKAQSSLISLNMTATAALGGFFFSDHGGDPRILLLIPIVSSVLGMVYIDHAVSIGYIGRFIQYRVKPRLAEVANVSEMVDYEVFARRFEQNRKFRVLLFALPLLLIFCGIPISALILAFFIQKTWTSTMFWAPAILGAVLTAVFLWFWSLMVAGRLWESSATLPGSETAH
jgi:hypothetical protein